MDPLAIYAVIIVVDINLLFTKTERLANSLLFAPFCADYWKEQVEKNRDWLMDEDKYLIMVVPQD